MGGRGASSSSAGRRGSGGNVSLSGGALQDYALANGIILMTMYQGMRMRLRPCRA